MNEVNCSSIFSKNHKLLEIVQTMSPIHVGAFEIIVEVLHYTYDNKKFDTGVHRHPFYELSLMAQGKMNYFFNGTEVEIDDDSSGIIFIPPETSHNRVVEQLPSVIVGFQIQIKTNDRQYAKFLCSMTDYLRESGYKINGAQELTTIIKQLFHEIDTVDIFYQDKAAILIHDFFITFFRECFGGMIQPLVDSYSTKKEITNFHERLISLACRYIEEHLGRQMQIDDIAHYCGMSKRHLNRIFSEHKGIALGNYIIQRKINEARKRIMCDDMQIKQVAFELGFSNLSYFSRLFKKYTGKTPISYRESR